MPFCGKYFSSCSYVLFYLQLSVKFEKFVEKLMSPVTTSLLCLVGWLNAYLQSTAVWNVWEALRMFSVSTEIRQTEDKDYNVQHNNIIYYIVSSSRLLSCPCCNRFIHDAFTHYCNLLDFIFALFNDIIYLIRIVYHLLKYLFDLIGVVKSIWVASYH